MSKDGQQALRQDAAPFDFPRALPLTAVEIAELLNANRFAEARHAVQIWSRDNRVRQLIEAGLYQEAVCEIERAAFCRAISRADYAAAMRERTLAGARAE